MEFFSISFHGKNTHFNERGFGNIEFGHEAGDAVLQAVATEMRSRFRDGDVVCRFGGEEFTIIAPGTSAVVLADRV